MEYVTRPDQAYQEEELWFPLSEDILAGEKDFHTLMLNDQLRMLAYQEAISRVIRPGMVVCEVGTGTGILSLWALQAGAARVYGIDVQSERLKDAVQRLHAAGFAERFVPCEGVSYGVELPEQADLVVSEILGNLADNEDMTPILADARRRFLKPGGRMLPAKATSWLVPVSSPQLHDQVRRQRCRSINGTYSLDDLRRRLGVAAPFDLYYDAILPRSTYLSQPQCIQGFNFRGEDKATYAVSRQYTVDKAGLLTGFKGYFQAEQGGGVVLDISGDDIAGRQTSDCWKHCYLPLREEFALKKGDELRLIFTRGYPSEKSLFRQLYRWQGTVRRRGKQVYRFSQQTGK